MIKKSIAFVVVLGFVGGFCHSFAASFDCAKAGTWVEKSICADQELSGLDSEMGETYVSLRKNAKNIDKKLYDSMRSEQVQWMARRNLCSELDCLANFYRARILELEDASLGLCTVASGVSPCIY